MNALRLAAAAILAVTVVAAQETETRWDFRGDPAGWSLDHDLLPDGGAAPAPGGCHLRSTGGDPYLSSPAFDLRGTTAFDVLVTLAVPQSTTGQIFWSVGGEGFTEPASVHFALMGGAPRTYLVRLAAAAPPPRHLTRIRLDPGSGPGPIELVALAIVPSTEFTVTPRAADPAVVDVRVDAYAPKTMTAAPVGVMPDTDLAIVTAPPADQLGPLPPGTRRVLVWSFRAAHPGVHCVDLRLGSDHRREGFFVPIGSDDPPSKLLDDVRALADAARRRGVAHPELVRFARPGIRRVPPQLLLAVPGGRPIFVDLAAPRAAGVIELEGGLRLEVAESAVPDAARGTIELRSTLASSQPIEVINWVPAAWWLDSDGRGAGQVEAIFPGLEFLGRGEASSSDKDDHRPSHVRFLPDPLKVTIPEIVVRTPEFTTGFRFELDGVAGPIFSAPDAVLHGVGALAGVVVPPVGDGRFENEIVARQAWPLAVGRTLTVKTQLRFAPNVATLAEFLWEGELGQAPPGGSRAEDRAATIRQSLALAPRAFLDTTLYDPRTRGFGHCVEPSWERTPSPDLPAVMLRLVMDHPEIPRAADLVARAHEALAAVPPRARMQGSKTHVAVRLAPFLVGGLEEAMRGMVRDPASLTLAAVEPRLHFQGPLAATHFEDTATGLLAAAALDLIEVARFTGSREAEQTAAQIMARLAKADPVPRGAQTWEVPLHTPDILASARAGLAGSEFDEMGGAAGGRRAWLAAGLPFVYTRDPAPSFLGRGATIAVFGATNFEAPNWIGMPVQWCGLCYAEALYRGALQRNGSGGPLLPGAQVLADDILLCAMRMQVPDGPAVGCLPDSFVPATQTRQGPMINPGSIYALLPYLEGRPPMLDFLALRPAGPWVNAPGRLTAGPTPSPARSSFTFEAPAAGLFHLALVRCPPPSRVTVDGVLLAESTDDATPGWHHVADQHWLLLRVRGPRVAIEVQFTR